MASNSYISSIVKKIDEKRWLPILSATDYLTDNADLLTFIQRFFRAQHPCVGSEKHLLR